MSGQYSLTDDFASGTNCLLEFKPDSDGCEPAQPPTGEDTIPEIRAAYEREQERCQKQSLRKAPKRKPDTPLYTLDEQDSTLPKNELKKIKKAKKSKAYRDSVTGSNKQLWGWMGTLLEHQRSEEAKYAAAIEENQKLKARVSELEKQPELPELKFDVPKYLAIYEKGDISRGFDDWNQILSARNDEWKQMVGDNDDWKQMVFESGEGNESRHPDINDENGRITPVPDFVDDFSDLIIIKTERSSDK